jgi:uncharacterized protein
VYVGARLSSQAPPRLIRPIIAGVLLASALALLKAPTPLLVLGALGAAAAMTWLSRPAVAVQPRPVPLESPA